MKIITLAPTFDCCIETTARKKYAELSGILLGNKTDNPETEEKLELLRLFLETADLKKLRAESEKYLISGHNVQFIVYFDKDALQYKMHITQ